MFKAYVFATIAMVFWGIAPIFGKLGLSGTNPLAALLIRSVLICLILFFIILFTGQWSSVIGVSMRDAAYIGIEGICAALLAQLAYYYALKYGEVGRVSPIAAAFPLVALLLGIVFLGEKVTIYKVAAAILIVTGIFLLRY